MCAAAIYTRLYVLTLQLDSWMQTLRAFCRSVFASQCSRASTAFLSGSVAEGVSPLQLSKGGLDLIVPSVHALPAWGAWTGRGVDRHRRAAIASDRRTIANACWIKGMTVWWVLNLKFDREASFLLLAALLQLHLLKDVSYTWCFYSKPRPPASRAAQAGMHMRGVSLRFYYWHTALHHAPGHFKQISRFCL